MPAMEIARQQLGLKIKTIERFPTGLCHQVYRVEELDGQLSVLRLSTEATRAYHQGALHWIPVLTRLEVPVPQIYAYGQWQDYYYTHFSYLPGQDLGEVYHQLNDEQKHQLAKDIVGITQRVATLPKGSGYGSSIGTLYSSWTEVLLANLDRSHTRIVANGVFTESVCADTRRLLLRMEPYFSHIQPEPYLDDLTTKNVLVYEGALSGIVDVDMISYGDSYRTIGMTRMALLDSGQDTDYISHLLYERQALPMQRQAVIFYTLLACVDFMSEVGMRFENGKTIPVLPQRVNGLSEHFTWLKDTLEMML